MGPLSIMSSIMHVVFASSIISTALVAAQDDHCWVPGDSRYCASVETVETTPPSTATGAPESSDIAGPKPGCRYSRYQICDAKFCASIFSATAMDFTEYITTSNDPADFPATTTRSSTQNPSPTTNDDDLIPVAVGRHNQWTISYSPPPSATPFTTVDGIPVAAVHLANVGVAGCYRLISTGVYTCEAYATQLSAWVAGTVTMDPGSFARVGPPNGDEPVLAMAVETRIYIDSHTVEMPPPTPFTTVQGVPVATRWADGPRYMRECRTWSEGDGHTSEFSMRARVGTVPYCQDQHSTEFLVEDRTLTPGETTVFDSITVSAGTGFLVVASETVRNAGSVTGSTIQTSATGSGSQTAAEGASGEENGAQMLRMLLLPAFIAIAIAMMLFF